MAAPIRFRRTGVLMALLLATAASAQDEIATFRVTDVGGELSIRYRLDEWINRFGPERSWVETPYWTEELSLEAQGYVYHPALLDWRARGGPLLLQYAYESDMGASNGSEVLYNLETTLDFLQRRNTPFTLWYRRDHPEVTTGLSGRFLAETDEYGARGRLVTDAAGAFLDWEAAHWDSFGSGLGTTLDEQLDRASVRTALPYRETDNLRLDLNWSDRTSRSGAPGIPIQRATISTASAELTGENRFGTARPLQLRQNLMWLTQTTEAGGRTALDDLSYTGNADWQYSEATRAFATARYRAADRRVDTRRTGTFRAGLDHRFTRHLNAVVEGDHARDRATGFTREVNGAQLSARYRRPLRFGSFSASARLGAQRTDQDAVADRVAVFDEPVVLAGTTPAPLNRAFVVDGSVRVSNEPMTQTFTEDIDYRLVTIGDSTTIERLIGGRIEDGQTVLVNYEVLTGGTVRYDTASRGLALSLGLFRHATLFAHFDDRVNDVIDGVPTTPLNDSRRTELGGRLDYPFDNGWTVGAEYRHTRQDEDISPYVRRRFETWARSAMYWNTRVRIGVQREKTELEKSPEDVDLLRYLVDVDCRLPGGWLLAYHAEFGDDDGGTLPRREARHALRLDWRYRQVIFALRGDFSDIRQGDSERTNRRVTAELRRDF